MWTWLARATAPDLRFKSPQETNSCSVLFELGERAEWDFDPACWAEITSCHLFLAEREQAIILWEWDGRDIGALVIGAVRNGQDILHGS